MGVDMTSLSLVVIDMQDEAAQSLPGSLLFLPKDSSSQHGRQPVPRRSGVTRKRKEPRAKEVCKTKL